MDTEIRSVEPLGDQGAVVLKFTSSILQARWKEFRIAGASWDYEGYTPHITLTYDVGDVDLKKIKPYEGPIDLGPEIYEALDENWKDGVVEKQEGWACVFKENPYHDTSGRFTDAAHAFEGARDLAREKLSSKIRGGDPTQTGFAHSMRVAANLKDPVLKVIGALHDIVEDSDVTVDELRKTFGDRIANAVHGLTKNKEAKEDTEVYLKRVMSNVDSLRVKIADMQDNMIVRPGTIMGSHLKAKQLLYSQLYPRLVDALAEYEKTQKADGLSYVFKDGTSEGANKAWAMRQQNLLPDEKQLSVLAYDEKLGGTGKSTATIHNHQLGIQYYQLRTKHGQDHPLTQEAYAQWQKAKDNLTQNYGLTKSQIGDLSSKSKTAAANNEPVSPKIKPEDSLDVGADVSSLSAAHSASEHENQSLPQKVIGSKDSVKAAYLAQMKAELDNKWSAEHTAAKNHLQNEIEAASHNGLSKGQLSAVKAHATMAFKNIKFGLAATKEKGYAAPVPGLKKTKKEPVPSSVPLDNKPLDLSDDAFSEFHWGGYSADQGKDAFTQKIVQFSRSRWVSMTIAQRKAIQSHVGAGFKTGSKSLAKGGKGLSNLDSALNHPLGGNMMLRRNMPQKYFWQALGLPHDGGYYMDNLSDAQIKSVVGKVYREPIASSTTYDLTREIILSEQAAQTGKLWLRIRAGENARGFVTVDVNDHEKETTLKKGANYVIRNVTKLDPIKNSGFSYVVDVDLIGHTP